MEAIPWYAMPHLKIKEKPFLVRMHFPFEGGGGKKRPITHQFADKFIHLQGQRIDMARVGNELVSVLALLIPRVGRFDEHGEIAAAQFVTKLREGIPENSADVDAGFALHGHVP